MMKKSLLRAGAALAVFTSAAGVVTTAVTTTTPISIVRAASGSKVADDTTERNIILHKYDNAAANDGVAGSDQTGEELTVGDTHKPLENIPFTVWQIKPNADVSRKTVMDYVKAHPDLDANSLPSDAPFTMGTVKKAGRTDASGKFDADLGAGTTVDGMYLVTEGASTSVKKATPPFVVAVPTTVQGKDGADDSLLYDVNVYPKNDTADIDLGVIKDVDGKNKDSVKAGADVEWTISANIPSDIYTPATADYPEAYAKTFFLMDPIDTKSLKVTSDSDIVVKVDGTALDATDYKITHSSAVSGYDTIKIELTQSGMKKAAGKKQLTATIKTTVLNSNDGIITNTADAYYEGPTGVTGGDTTVTDPKDPGDTDPNTPNIPKDPDHPGDTNPVVYMGNINLKKTTEDGTALANATFKVAASEEDAKAGKWLTDKDGKELTVVTDADGKGEFTGLEIDPSTAEKDLYIVETDAPAGYDIDGQIHKVTAKPDTTLDATIKDKDNMMPNLPMTGGDFKIMVLALAVGLFVVAGGTVYFFANDRKKKSAK